eukprot:14556685-Alexandrium_andersonii.AAC.1
MPDRHPTCKAHNARGWAEVPIGVPGCCSQISFSSRLPTGLGGTAPQSSLAGANIAYHGTEGSRGRGGSTDDCNAV